MLLSMQFAKRDGDVYYIEAGRQRHWLHAKIQAYHLQDKGADTLDANLMLGYPGDARDYQIAAKMLNYSRNQPSYAVNK